MIGARCYQKQDLTAEHAEASAKEAERIFFRGKRDDQIQEASRVRRAAVSTAVGDQRRGTGTGTAASDQLPSIDGATGLASL